MSDIILPANEDRAQDYSIKNYYPAKYLRQDGSVTESQPVDVINSVLPTGGATSDNQEAEITLLQGLLEKETSISIDAEQINLNTDELETLLGDIKSNQTSGLQKVQLNYSDGTTAVNIQNPLPVDGDSIYAKDIDLTHSTKVGWTGNIIDLFDCPNDVAGIYNDTVTNPKIIYIPFCRTLYFNTVGLGCNLTGKTFSNLKMEFIGSDGTIRSTYDDSTNNTKYGTRLYSIQPTACVGIKFSFYTADTDVGISNITIQKETTGVSRIQGLMPNNIIADVGVTYGKSLKSSISDDLNFPSFNTPIGELRVVEPVRLVGAGFEGSTIDTRFWTTGATGTSASIAQSGCELIITSGTSNGATVYAYSVRRARYVTGSSMRFRCVGKLGDTGTANNKRRWGIGWGASMPTITDGAWFQVDGTEFSIVTCKGGVETKVTAANFNGDLDGYALTALVTTLEIYYTNSIIKFVIGGLTLHTVTASLASWTNTLAFHSFVDSINSNVLGASVTINVRTASVYRLGKIETQPITYHLSGDAATHVLKLGQGLLHKIVFNNTSGTSINIVDNITGNTPSLGIITTTASCIGPWDVYYPFNNGLILITTGNGLDATIVYE